MLLSFYLKQWLYYSVEVLQRDDSTVLKQLVLPWGIGKPES